MKNTLKLPLSFDSDFDLVDADGAAVFLLGANVIQCGPDLAAEITKRVNNHEKLTKALGDLCDCIMETRGTNADNALHEARTLLAQLDGEMQ